MLELRLFPGLPGGRRARLGPITGAVEESIDADDPAAFGRLLDRLLVATEDSTVAPGRAFDLAIADHDRLAAALYRRQFGAAITSTVRCRQCGRDFEVSFDLDAVLQAATPASVETITGPDEQGTFRLREGGRFRLPTLRDRLATTDTPADEVRRDLFRLCTEDMPETAETLAAIEDAMETVGPLIAGEFPAPCPHCHAREEAIPFSIQQFLLDALAFERRFLPQEVHCLARTYGWSRQEILGLPVTDRRQHVRMILADLTAR